MSLIDDAVEGTYTVVTLKPIAPPSFFSFLARSTKLSVESPRTETNADEFLFSLPPRHWRFRCWCCFGGSSFHPN